MLERRLHRLSGNSPQLEMRLAHPTKSKLVGLGAAALVMMGAWPTLAQEASLLLRPRPLPPDVTPQVLESQCGGYVGFYGPMDYRTAPIHHRRMVEGRHYDKQAEAMLAGRTYGGQQSGFGYVGGDFQYTLRSFPNHPGALYLTEQLGTKLKTEMPPGMEYPLECWYVRAFKLVPDDPYVRVMYGVYLANRDRRAEARRHLAIAVEQTKDSRTLQYQIGLAYLKMGDFEAAQHCALRAKQMGYAFTFLADQIRSAGKWSDAIEREFDEQSTSAETAASGAKPASKD